MSYKRTRLAQIGILLLLFVAVGAWALDLLKRNDVVGLVAPFGFAAIILAVWKPWRTLRK